MMLLGVSIGSVAVVSIVSFVASRDALSDNVTDQLTATREVLARQIEAQFATMEGQAASLAENVMVVEALAQFSVGWDQLADVELDAGADGALDAAYEEFISDVPQEDRPDRPAVLQPSAANARYLQHRYAVAGDVEDRSEVVDVDDGTFYNRAHVRFHPALRSFVERFGYGDLYLIAVTGEVVYSVGKRLDFATNLLEGPHRTSVLASLVDDLRVAPESGRVVFSDYDFYLPARDAPAGFVASPVVNPTTGAFMGVVAMALPLDEIDRVMTNAGDWQASGFGRTGQSYLVGPDLTMRSQARGLVESRGDYLAGLSAADVEPRVVELIDRYDSSVLLQPVDTAAACAAVDGDSGTAVVGYLGGVETLASYAPLDLPGLRWGIVAQFDLAEATAPVLDLQRSLLIAAGVIVLVVTGLTMLLASVFVRPVERLTAWAERVRGGDLSARTEEDHGDDEFGQLFASFGDMVDALRHQREVAEEQAAENEQLLDTMLPGAIAERLRAGEERIADEYTDVAVIDARLMGLSELTTTATADEAADVLNDLAFQVEEVLDSHGVEKIRSVGTRYTAACGLMHPRVDYRNRAVAFALDLRERVLRYAAESDLDLAVKVGVSAGSVEGGVIGRAQPVFVIWGTTVAGAETLSEAAGRGEIVTTGEVASYLSDQFEFSEHPTVEESGDTCWLVVPDGEEPTGSSPPAGEVIDVTDDPIADVEAEVDDEVVEGRR